MASPCTPLFHSITLCYYEQKIQELRECFEAKQQEFEDQLRRLELELQGLDNQFAKLDQEERDQHEKAEQLSSFKDVWSKRQEKYEKELQHLKQLKEQLRAKFREDCKSARQQLEGRITANQALLAGQRQDAPATLEMQLSPKVEVNVKEDNKIILDKLVYVQSRIAAITLAPKGVPQKHQEAYDDQLRRLDQESWFLKEQINILTQRLDRKKKKSDPTTLHLDNLEQRFLQLLKNQSCQKK